MSKIISCCIILLKFPMCQSDANQSQSPDPFLFISFFCSMTHWRLLPQLEPTAALTVNGCSAELRLTNATHAFSYGGSRESLSQGPRTAEEMEINAIRIQHVGSL